MVWRQISQNEVRSQVNVLPLSATKLTLNTVKCRGDNVFCLQKIRIEQIKHLCEELFDSLSEIRELGPLLALDSHRAVSTSDQPERSNSHRVVSAVRCDIRRKIGSEVQIIRGRTQYRWPK